MHIMLAIFVGLFCIPKYDTWSCEKLAKDTFMYDTSKHNIELWVLKMILLVVFGVLGVVAVFESVDDDA